MKQETESEGVKRPRLSIGVLTFNSDRTLEMCLKSILRQGYSRDDLDIFLVDAGSTDQTLRMACDYGIQVYAEAGCTRGRGRNICIERARSDLLVMLDSDIVIPAGWLSAVERHFDDPSVMEVASPYYTPEPKSGFVKRLIYYLTSGWEVHVKGAQKRENWVSE